jgi:hypothetical protein
MDGSGPHGTSPWRQTLTGIAAPEDKIVRRAVVEAIAPRPIFRSTKSIGEYFDRYYLAIRIYVSNT